MIRQRANYLIQCILAIFGIPEYSFYFCAHWGKSYILTKMNRDLLLID